ncbi:MAG: hypothetical protein HQM03_12010 [Magnetococcales bacterium]|nr:hypothetical protein [Magnetococcales bacterium]
MNLFPLPFLDQTIQAAYRRDTKAAIEFLEYLTTSTNQQKRAARVMEQIVVAEAMTRRNSAELAALAKDLEWLPQPYPETFGVHLPQLLEITQGVRAALEASSPYRRIELLNIPLERLNGFITGLAGERSARLATDWGGVAQHWREILRTARKIWQEEARHAHEIPNPYVVGPQLNPEQSKNRFKGRQEIFRRIEELSLAPQPPVLLLVGGRRMGKSSSLNYLKEKMGPEWIPAQVDGLGLSLDSLSSVPKGLARRIQEGAQKSRNLTLPSPDAEKLEKEPFPTLLEWMDRVEAALAPEKRILLCIDEFEKLDDIPEQRQGDHRLLNFWRHIAMQRRRWVVLFSGYAFPEELPPHWSACLNLAQTVPLGYLRKEEAQELIQAPIPEFPDVFSPEAVNEVLHLTRCHPYLVQLLCSLVVERLNEQKRLRAEAGDVTAVVPEAFKTGRTYFDEWWRKDLQEADRQTLTRLILHESPLPEDAPSLRKLEKYQYVEPFEGSYRLQIPLLEKYAITQR